VEITSDASVFMAVILNEPSKARLLEVTEGTELVSPPTLPWEVGNGLSALFKRKRINLDQAKAALEAFRQIPVRLADVEIERAVELAKAEDMYAYDAYVLECARTYRAPLLSLDDSQCRIAEKLGITVMEV
jgi:predicted nucleic acid-binding protein